MNKKFIKVSISIFLFSFIFILGFKFIFRDKLLYVNSTEEAFNNQGPIIKYSGFEEDENIYKIKVSIKNNSKYYASFNNISLELPNNSQGGPIFNGYDNTEREYLLNLKPGDEYTFSSYLDSNEEREYVFEISKGLSFDKEVFDTNRMNISYDIRYFNYRINNKTVIGSASSRRGSEPVDTSLEPFIIE